MTTDTASVVEALGRFGQVSEATQSLGRVSFVAALGTAGFLERVQFRLRFLEARTWWASNGRDVLNAAVFGLLFGAGMLIGFSGPMCLVIAATILVLVNTLQSSLGEKKGATRLSIAVTFLLGLPVVISPAWVDGAFKSLLAFLF